MYNHENYTNAPPLTLQSIDRYAKGRIPPGSFLIAVLENDLRMAMGRADRRNREALWDVVRYCVNEIPSSCWGSPELVNQWLEGD